LKAYVDTSFLVSLYSPDSNSAIAARTMQISPGSHFISALVELETVNALQLRVFRKEISSSQAQSSLRGFEKDILGGILQLRPLSDQAFERAGRLAKQTTARLGTRTAYLLHVAAALDLGVDYLYSFDQQQRKLAEVVRLKLN